MAPPSKKRKHDLAVPQTSSNGVDTSKPTAVFKATGPRLHTLSVAVPGSIIANAQSHEQKTSLAGYIARALAVFCVDEVVIFNDGQSGHHAKTFPRNGGRHRSSVGGGDDDGYTGFSDPDHFFYHLLSYLETPPHLRRLLFPMHPNLKTAGTLPSLDMPHHFRSHEWCRYREGVVVEQAGAAMGVLERSDPVFNSKKRRHKLEASLRGDQSKAPAVLVEAGLGQKVYVEGQLEQNVRVTLKFPSESRSEDSETGLVAEVVTPNTPREEAGYYWGYSIRRASSISAVFTECPFDGGYDLTFGTSERGKSLSTVRDQSIPKFKHMMVVFGGVGGLEVAVGADEELSKMGIVEPKELFDHWVNLCPGQGSRTIRTEEAVWMGLMGLREIVTRNENR